MKSSQLEKLSKRMTMENVAELIAHIQLRNAVVVHKDMLKDADPEDEFECDSIKEVLREDTWLGDYAKNVVEDDQDQFLMDILDMIDTLAWEHTIKNPKGPKRKKAKRKKK